MNSNIISSPSLFSSECNHSIRFEFNKETNILRVVTRKDNSEQFFIKIIKQSTEVINDIEHLVLTSSKNEFFYIVDNKFHREGDKPALRFFRKDLMEEGLFEAKIWMENGLYHREGDKPALIYINGDLAWFKRGYNKRNPFFNASFYIPNEKALVKYDSSNIEYGFSNIEDGFSKIEIDMSEKEYQRHIENKLLDYSFHKES